MRVSYRCQLADGTPDLTVAGSQSDTFAASAGNQPVPITSESASKLGIRSFEGASGAPTRNRHPPEDDTDSRPLVSFARSGIAANWNAAACQSILELAEACDVPFRWACLSGVSHNCESGLVSGAVAYGPEPLDKPAEGNILVCCSQSIRDVVTDL